MTHMQHATPVIIFFIELLAISIIFAVRDRLEAQCMREWRQNKARGRRWLWLVRGGK